MDGVIPGDVVEMKSDWLHYTSEGRVEDLWQEAVESYVLYRTYGKNKDFEEVVEKNKKMSNNTSITWQVIIVWISQIKYIVKMFY